MPIDGPKFKWRCSYQGSIPLPNDPKLREAEIDRLARETLPRRGTPQIATLAGMTPLGITRPLQADQAEIARRKTAAPLRPKIAQKPLDFGLFSDDASQTDLVDLARRGTS
jgi:hypothetical protein